MFAGAGSFCADAAPFAAFDSNAFASEHPDTFGHAYAFALRDADAHAFRHAHALGGEPDLPAQLGLQRAVR